MKYPAKSEIQFKQTPAHIQKAINTAACEYWSAPFSQLSLHPQTNQTVSKNAEAFPELQQIPCKHLLQRAPCSQHFIFLDPRIQQNPYLSCYSVEGLWGLTTFCSAQKLLKPSVALPASLSLASGEALRPGSSGKPAASTAEGWAGWREGVGDRPHQR